MNLTLLVDLDIKVHQQHVFTQQHQHTFNTTFLQIHQHQPSNTYIWQWNKAPRINHHTTKPRFEGSKCKLNVRNDGLNKRGVSCFIKDFRKY